MNFKEIEAVEIRLMQIKHASLEAEAGENVEVSLPPGFWVKIIDLLLYILLFAKSNAINPDGTAKKLKWYDFILNKNLREFVGKVISGVLDFFSNKPV
jgi:hypothetical protein